MHVYPLTAGHEQLCSFVMTVVMTEEPVGFSSATKVIRLHAVAPRLFESTFQLDVLSAREFCEADDRWIKAVQFLDADGRAGWELLAAMLNSNWRLRPTAQSCLVHRFLSSS